MALTLTNQFIYRNPSLQTPNKSSLLSPRIYSLPRVSCRKKDIHPEFHEDAKVYCNGELVMTTGGTRKDYNVDIWSGNHPFYLGNRTAVVDDADQLEKFRRRYGEMTHMMKIPVLKGELEIPAKYKAGYGKNKKKK